jgi:hypothetical protein
MMIRWKASAWWWKVAEAGRLCRKAWLIWKAAVLAGSRWEWLLLTWRESGVIRREARLIWRHTGLIVQWRLIWWKAWCLIRKAGLLIIKAWLLLIGKTWLIEAWLNGWS